MGGEPDPQNIVKPAEMARKWKAEHPDWEQWPLEWTPLIEALPAVAELVDLVGITLGVASWERVRLMRLQPGGGELTRHSDITDPDAGAAEGKLARIHVPLFTNQQVRFPHVDPGAGRAGGGPHGHGRGVVPRYPQAPHRGQLRHAPSGCTSWPTPG